MDEITDADRIATALERIAAATEEQAKLGRQMLHDMNQNHAEATRINQTMLDRVDRKSQAEDDLDDVRRNVEELAAQVGLKLADDEGE